MSSPDRRSFIVRESLAAVSAAAAAETAAAARDAVARDGRFTICLAGGETPRSLYRLLARDYRDVIAWGRTEICFGDERCVPPHNPQSNFRLAWSTLLEQVPIVEQRVHRILGELGPDAAAREYDSQLRRLFVEDPGIPTFDVAVMGVGNDGHTASLFPGDSALEEKKRWAAPAHAPAGVKVRERVTLTLPVLTRTRTVMFLCAGKEKREIVSRILSNAAPDLPAARILGVEKTIWLLDGAVAP